MTKPSRDKVVKEGKKDKQEKTLNRDEELPMAVGHIGYDRGTPHGSALYEALKKLEEGIDGLSDSTNTLIQMKDSGNLTSYAVAKYGFTDLSTATAGLAEMEAAKGALDGIAATLTQLFSKMRNG